MVLDPSSFVLGPCGVQVKPHVSNSRRVYSIQTEWRPVHATYVQFELAASSSGQVRPDQADCDLMENQREEENKHFWRGWLGLVPKGSRVETHDCFREFVQPERSLLAARIRTLASLFEGPVGF